MSASELLWAMIIISTVFALSFEYPIFGIIVLISIIAFSLWMWYESHDWDKEHETIRKLVTQREKEKNDLLNKIPKEMNSIIENNIKIVASAYRTSVT